MTPTDDRSTRTRVAPTRIASYDAAVLSTRAACARWPKEGSRGLCARVGVVWACGAPFLAPAQCPYSIVDESDCAGKPYTDLSWPHVGNMADAGGDVDSVNGGIDRSR